jgi:trimeric autotransporter adhesin
MKKVSTLLLFLVSFCGSIGAQPTISAVSPMQGHPGSTVTITGSNFNPSPANNIVYFGATRASITAASTISLTATVPAGATYMPVSVNNTALALTGYSQYPFLPTYNNSAYIPGTVNMNGKVDFTTGTSPQSVAIGDLDGDGKADLAVANFNTVSVFRNTSSSGAVTAASFAAKVDFSTGTQPSSVAIGDLDGDGKADLAVANANAPTVSVLRNTSSSGAITSGSFAARVDFTTGEGPVRVAMGDLDGDGKADLAVANYYSNTVSVFRNTGSSGAITAGSFAAKVDFTTGAQPHSVAIGDLDGDGKADLAVANATSSTVSVFRNTSSSGVITAGSFAARVDFATGTNPLSVAIGDLDGDGKADLAVANTNSATVSVFRNTGSSGAITVGSFAAKADFATGTHPLVVSIGDLDGDGKADLVVVNNGSTSVSVFRNTSSSGAITSGSFAARVNFTTGSSPYSVAIGDLDGDGKADLAVANFGSSTVSVIRNSPLSPVTGATSVCAGETTTLSNSTSGGIWSSAAPDKATVDSGTGVVTGVSAGTATISYSVTGGTITVVVTVNQMPTTISGSLSVCIGTTTTLMSSPAGGTWNSGNIFNASVGAASGVVTGVRVGTANISYTLPGGCRRKVVVSVSASPATITGSLVMCVGSTVSLSSATTEGTWSSNNGEVASVASGTGIVTGVSAGTAIISYTKGSCVRTAIVTVNAALAANTGIAVACVGQGTTLSNTTSGGTWSSSNTSRATVNATTGLVAGVSAGTVNISYRLGAGCFSNTVVTVKPALGSISGATSVCPGATTTLSFPDSGGVWSSSNTARATIAGYAGIVTGISAGTVYITYTLGGCFRTALLTVSTPPGSIGGGAAPVCEGATTALSCSPGGGTWSSANHEVAGIGSTGIVSGIAAGTVSMTYTNAAGCSTVRIITVNPVPGAISGNVSLCVGSTEVLSSTPAGGTWSSGAITKATIGTHTGVLAGVSAGTAGITYTVSGCSSSEVATVNALPATITGALTLCAGSTGALASVTTGGTWSSNNGEVASVASGTGIVTGVNAGTAIISYTNGTCTTTAIVTVNAALAANTGIAVVCVGQGTTLSNTTSGGTWSSSNTSRATVNAATGLVAGVSAGTVNISYIVGAGCYSNTVVTVKPALGSITGAASVCPGATTTLSFPDSAGVWSSSNTAIATIAGYAGIVTGVSAGTAYITYTLGGCFRTVLFTVSTPPGSISGGATPVCEGATTALSCSPGGGTWSSDNTALATISATGLVTGVSPGTATISYTNSSSCRSVRIVTVNEVPSAITGPASICRGVRTTFTSSPEGGVWSMLYGGFFPDPLVGVIIGAIEGVRNVTYTLPSGCYATRSVLINFTPPDIRGIAATSVGGSTLLSNGHGAGVWSSSNNDVATVTAGFFPWIGIVSGVSIGTATISYTSGGCSATKILTVNAPIAASYGTPLVCVGQTNATLGNPVSGGTWSSSNGHVATVHATTGLLTGIGVGTAHIIYTSSPGYSTTLIVTVTAALPAITGALNVCPGGTATLSHTTGGGTWSSSNTTTATIDASTGVVAGISPGTTVITYSSGVGCYKTAVFTVSSSLGSITTTGSAALCAGATTTLSCIPGGGTWSSSHPAIATISATGLVTGVSSGTATISYTNSSSCRSVRVVTINALPSSITGPSTMCATTSASFSASPSGGTWSLPTYWAGVNATTGVVSSYAAGSAVLSYTLPSGCSRTHALTMFYTPSVITGIATTSVGASTTLYSGYSSGIWSSSNPAVAAVGTSGIVSGVSIGTATISYAAGSCARTRVVTVNAPIAASYGTPVVCVGQTNATLGNPVAGGTWSSGATSIATVHAATGLLTGIGAGTANITYTTSPGMYTIMVATVSAAMSTNTGTTTICSGATTTLTNATTGGTWSSSNTLTATVVPGTGVVTGVAGGTATISYSVNVGCYRVSTITINNAPNISGATSVRVGGIKILGGSPGGGTWSSANPAIAPVSGLGVVSGISVGVTTITYTLSTTGCFKTHPITVLAARPGDEGAEPLETQALLKVYPNPTSGILTIDAPVAGTFVVYTIDGKQMVQYNVATSANMVSLPSSLAAGIYMCRFIGADGSTAIVRLVYQP